MRSSQGASSAQGGASHRIRVVVRLRPTKAEATIRVDLGARTLTVPNSRSPIDGAPQGVSKGAVDHTAEGLRFGVDAIYDTGASQRDVFDGECAPLVAGVLEGVTGTLLAYGQTGAGKTYTVLGKGGATSGGGYDDRGLVPRAIGRLFELAARKRRGGASVEVRLSVLEVYNETLVDLLRPRDDDGGPGCGRGGPPPPPEPTVCDGPDGGVRVKNLEMAVASSAEEANALLYDAEIARAVGSHAMNAASSRSHLVVTAHVTTRELGGGVPADDDGDGGGPEERFAKLHLVDLAGSERIKLTASRGATATARPVRVRFLPPPLYARSFLGPRGGVHQPVPDLPRAGRDRPRRAAAGPRPVPVLETDARPPRLSGRIVPDRAGRVPLAGRRPAGPDDGDAALRGSHGPHRVRAGREPADRGPP